MSLLLGSTAPNFTIDSTAGQINFHDWAGDSWVFFFSHRPTSRRCAPLKWAAPRSWRKNSRPAT